MKNLFRRLKESYKLLESGGPGFAQIAITNLCNANCGFCNFAVSKFDHRNKKSLTLKEVQDAVDILKERNIRYITFVGGEPLVHPDLVAMCAYTTKAGLQPLICTNGSLLFDETVRALAEAGVKNAIISIDATDAALHDENRGLPNLTSKIRRANALFRKLGVHTTASVTLSRLLTDLKPLPDYLKDLGFERLTFSYPLTHLNSNYLSFSDSALVGYTPEELISLYEGVKALKNGFPIMNPTESLNDMIRFVKKEPQKFGCLGGSKYFFVDWNLDVYRCHFWKTPMANLYDFPKVPAIRDNCTACMIDCYRDPSVIQHIGVSVGDALRNLRRGNPIQAARSLLTKNNFLSLKTVASEIRWILNF